jgi:hypothetical protein
MLLAAACPKALQVSTASSLAIFSPLEPSSAAISYEFFSKTTVHLRKRPVVFVAMRPTLHQRRTCCIQRLAQPARQKLCARLPSSHGFRFQPWSQGGHGAVWKHQS